MMQRVKQVWYAIRAKIYPYDKAFIHQYLNDKEAALFWQMNLPDQRHSLNVAYSAIDLAQNEKKVNRRLLIRCALLHDIGKMRDDVSTVDKIITVLAHNLAPQWAEAWARLGRGSTIDNLRHAFYIYFHHPQISSGKLRAIGLFEIAEIVQRHHKAPEDHDPLELVLLRQADELN